MEPAGGINYWPAKTFPQARAWERSAAPAAETAGPTVPRRGASGRAVGCRAPTAASPRAAARLRRGGDVAPCTRPPSSGPVAAVTAGGSQRLLLGRGRRCGELQSRVVAGSQLKGKNADEGVSASPRLPAASGRRYCAALFTETGA